LGWSDDYADQLLSHERALRPVRISADYGQSYSILDLEGTSTQILAPHCTGLERPAVGDWLLVGPGSEPEFQRRLARRSLLVRQVAGRTSAPQVIAANLDTVFIVTTVGADFNPRRIDRYLAAVAGSGITPVLVLNKADLASEGVASYGARLPAGVPAVFTSALFETGLDALLPWVRPGATVGLIGSSGVGKSSLINALMKEDRQDLGAVRVRDEQGQHTTTRRELLVLPNGAVLVDTPGMRELGLWNAGGLDAAFSEIAALEEACRFRNCEHDSEPGCAVIAAMETGALSAERLDSWYTLQREADRHRARREVVARREDRQVSLKSRRSARLRDQKRVARQRRHARRRGSVED
jgi:ribosome biogenesis GTPase